MPSPNGRFQNYRWNIIDSGVVKECQALSRQID
jgi:hypothetical protein